MKKVCLVCLIGAIDLYPKWTRQEKRAVAHMAVESTSKKDFGEVKVKKFLKNCNKWKETAELEVDTFMGYVIEALAEDAQESPIPKHIKDLADAIGAEVLTFNDLPDDIKDIVEDTLKSM